MPAEIRRIVHKSDIGRTLWSDFKTMPSDEVSDMVKSRKKPTSEITARKYSDALKTELHPEFGLNMLR